MEQGGAIQRYGIGRAGAVGMGSALWSTDDVIAMAQFSPQIALAKAMHVPFAPFVLPIVNTFNDTTTAIGNMQTFTGAANTGTSSLAEPTVVDAVLYEIDSPNLFSGQVFQSLAQFFYSLQSGITCTMMVDGAPKYQVAPFYTPVKMVCATLNESWPCGWVLQPNQSIIMQFQQSIPVPATPTTVTVGFRMWQPVDTGGLFVQMSSKDAFSRLLDLYNKLGDAQAVNQLQVIQGQPVNR